MRVISSSSLSWPSRYIWHLAQDVGARVGGAEERSLDALLEQRQLGDARSGCPTSVMSPEAGDHDGARLADGGERLADVLAGAPRRR